MAEVATTSLAVVLGHLEVQDHHLVTPPGMLHRALVGSLDPQLGAAAMLAVGLPPEGPGPDINTTFAFDPHYFQARYAYNHSCVGHRYSLH